MGPKTCIMPHVHLGSICDENESGWHIDSCFLRSDGERDRNSKALTETTFECPRARDAAGLAFLYTQNGYQGNPFRPSQPRPPRSLTPRHYASRKRVSRCGVNQTSAKYHLGSVPQTSCTSGRSVVFNNPGAFDLWNSSLARE